VTISIPSEEFDNPYVIRELHFYFHSSGEETAGREGYGGAAHEEVRFALDSPLEESGFESLVPLTPKRLNGSMPVSAMRK
jgi:hypothetical protein